MGCPQDRREMSLQSMLKIVWGYVIAIALDIWSSPLWREYKEK